MKAVTNGYCYEYKCAELLRKHGFSKVSVTKSSGDQGVDIIAYANGKKYAIQCKFYSSPVGNSAIQEVYAGAKFYNCDIAAVITNSTFTPAAVELADATGVLLWPNDNIPIQIPLHYSLMRTIGVLTTIFGVLCAWGAFSFDGIKYSALQQFESILIIFTGITALLNFKKQIAWLLALGGYLSLFLLSLIISWLCSKIFNLTSFIFLFFAIITYANILQFKKQHLQ